MANHRIQRDNITRSLLMPQARRAISTRSQNLQVVDQNVDPAMKKSILSNHNGITNKRKADASPLKNKTTENKKVKRSALGNLTNASVVQDENRIKSKFEIPLKKSISVENNVQNVIVQQPTVALVKQHSIENVLKPINENKVFGQPIPNKRGTKILTRAAARNAAHSNSSNKTNKSQAKPSAVPSEKIGTQVKPKENHETVPIKQTRRISNEFEKTEDSSLYVSALDEMSSYFDSKATPDIPTSTSLKENVSLKITESAEIKEDKIEESSVELSSTPEGVDDFDKENWDDPFQVSHYAMDIFKYLKEREEQFVIKDYMSKQLYLTTWMRSLLIDWMVEVQESFELNHETLYLAVKIVDIYLCKAMVTKDTLQLLGAAALFISSKFDERVPPLIDDFLYICDGAYDQAQLIQMERQVFKAIGYDLGIPLSYRFLRRYARCGKVPMPVLTLARFILEYSLMDYATIHFSDSKMASAALFMANRMKNLPGWNKTLSYYSGYEVEDFANIVPVLNAGIHRKPRNALNTIRNKYSHTVFLEVTKVPLKTTTQLFETEN